MIKKTIFVTATNTNVGKTFATLLLLEEFNKKGYKVGAFKPIETGVKEEPEDAKKLLEKSKKLNPAFKNITIEEIAPITFELPASPFVAKKNTKIDFEKIKKCFEKIKNICDIVIIEGAGGLLVPVENNFFMIDFINFFNATALLVTHNKLGCINDTLLSLNLLNQKQIKYLWCINNITDEKTFSLISLPYYKNKFKNIYYLQKNIQILANLLLLC